MNQKPGAVTGDEVGSDNGEFLPENKRGWALTHLDLQAIGAALTNKAGEP